jgi:hypothetical protein
VGREKGENPRKLFVSRSERKEKNFNEARDFLD